jgi:small-conductance mechanosensitive channel
VSAVGTALTKEGLTITVDGLYAFRMGEADLDAEDGRTYEEARDTVSGRLQAAIAAARSSRRMGEIVPAVALTAIGTLTFLLAVWVLARARGWLRSYLARRIERRVELGAQEFAWLLRAARGASQLALLFVIAALAEEWLRFVFARFPYTRPWSERLTSYVGIVASDITDAFVDAVPGLVMVALIAALAHLCTKILKAVALGVEAGRYELPGVDRDTVRLARRLTTAFVWLFALAMAYPYLPGSSSDAFKGLSVLVGVMLSLGASGLVSQAAGGLILTFGRVLRPGEWVRVGDVEGEVVTVGTFSTSLRTVADHAVNVPNSVLLATISQNFSRPTAAASSTLETSVTIGYGTPWRQVHAMLLTAAERTPEIEREPRPMVIQTALSDFYVGYTLRVRLLQQPRREAVLSALNANVQDIFNEYGVQIMSPHYVFDPAGPVVVPRARWFDAPAVEQHSADGAKAPTSTKVSGSDVARIGGTGHPETRT